MSSWLRSRGAVTPDLVPRGRVLIGKQGDLVSAQMSGGFGNRIFQILAGMAYAERTGKRFVFFEEHITNNPHTPPVKMRQMLYSWFSQVMIYRGRVDWIDYVDTGAPIPDMSGSVAIRGNFQDDAFFSPTARQQFSIPEPSKRILDISGIDFSHSYFMHFRLGDYVNSSWDVDLTLYYPEAVRRILQVDPLATFLLFSDEPDRINMKKLKFPTIKMAMMPVVDIGETLWLMSKCNGGICANSTFSYMGGFGSKGSGPFFRPDVWRHDGSARGLASWAITIPVKPVAPVAPRLQPVVEEVISQPTVTPVDEVTVNLTLLMTPPTVTPAPAPTVTPAAQTPSPTVTPAPAPAPTVTSVGKKGKSTVKNNQIDISVIPA